MEDSLEAVPRILGAKTLHLPSVSMMNDQIRRPLRVVVAAFQLRRCSNSAELFGECRRLHVVKDCSFWDE